MYGITQLKVGKCHQAQKLGVDLIVPTNRRLMDEVEHIAFAPSAYSTETIPTPKEHHDDQDDDDDYVFYCSNDGEEYANSMGESFAQKMQASDGEPCICIDVDGSCMTVMTIGAMRT